MTNYTVTDTADGLWIIRDAEQRGQSNYVRVDDYGRLAEFGTRQEAQDYADSLNEDDEEYLERCAAAFAPLN